MYCRQDGAAGDAADDAEDDTEEDGEETALEGYETVLDKVDNPVHEYQMFRGTLFSMMMFTLHTHTHPFNGPLSGTTRVSRYQKGKPMWILLKQETVSGSGISWAICKSAPRSRQITTPAPHHSVFYRPDPFLMFTLQ